MFYSVWLWQIGLLSICVYVFVWAEQKSIVCSELWLIRLSTFKIAKKENIGQFGYFDGGKK